MTNAPIIVSLDVGTAYTKICVARQLGPEKEPSVIALGVTATEGLRKGNIVDIQDATRSIHIALEQAAKMIEEDISEVIVSLNGQHLTAKNTTGKVAVARADGEVSQDDIDRVRSNANPGPSTQNNEILEMVLKNFILDEETGIKNPIGMNGIRLEVESLLLEGSSSAVKNLDKCLEGAGLEIRDRHVGILAASESILSKKQKELGVMVLDIGAGTTSLAVYEEGRLIHVAVIPLGAGHLTTDLAIGLRSSVDVAETVKIKYGYAMESAIDEEKRKNIDLSKIHEDEEGVFPVSYVASIIEERLKEIFTHVRQELMSIEREGLLPAGVIMVGGGANMRSIIELAKQELQLPVKIGKPAGVKGSIADVDNPFYATITGLILYGFEQQEEEEITVEEESMEDEEEGPHIGEGIKNFISKLLP